MRWLPVFLVLLLVGCTEDAPATEPAPVPEPEVDTTPVNETAPPILNVTRPYEWVRHNDAPGGRTEVASVSVGENLYVVGGFTGTLAATNEVAVFHHPTSTWSTAAPFPLPIHHTAMTAFEGDIFVFGGYNAFPFQATAASFRYNIDADQWTPISPLPEARGAHRAVALDDGIMIAGGVGPDGLLASTVFYDPTSDIYSPLAPMQDAREHFALARVGDDVYAATGRVGGLDDTIAKAEVYDIQNDTWEAIPDAPTARGGGSGDSLDGMLIVVGGEFTGGTNAEVEAYVPENRTWLRMPDLPTPRHGLGTGVMGDRLYVVMGGPQPNLEVSGALESLGLRIL